MCPYNHGIHNIKVGVQWYDDILSEQDTFGIVDPTFNPVCLNSDGSAYTGAGLTNPNNCTGPLTANPGYDPLLACYDLTRTGNLPASNGCPGSTSSTYLYKGRANIRQFSPYIEDLMRIKNWTFHIGLRGDYYYGITKAGQAEPRLGASYTIKPTNTVLSFSYARTLETPFNENLVLASLGCNDPVVNDIMATIQGYPCLTAPLTPGTRNEISCGSPAGFRPIPGSVQRRVHLEIHGPRVRLQRIRQHTHHLSDRVEQVQDSRLRSARQHAELSRLQRVHIVMSHVVAARFALRTRSAESA